MELQAVKLSRQCPPGNAYGGQATCGAGVSPSLGAAPAPEIRPGGTRYKSAYIFGAVCPGRWATAALVMPFANTEAMNAQLSEISKTVASGAHAILVMDGAGWHGANALCIPENISTVMLPPYAPELNPVENIWAYLRANCLAISVFDIYDAIVTRC